MKNKIIYLGLPYTFNPEESFRIANEVASVLMDRGYIVFSPISHSHPIAQNYSEEKRIDQQFWLNQDLPMLLKCDEVFFILIGENGTELFVNSKGCQAEYLTAKQKKMPIKYIKYINNKIEFYE